MKRIIITIGLLLGMSAFGFAQTDVSEANTYAYSSAVTISTQPAVFTTTNTINQMGEIRIWNYSADVMYVNFSLPTSSTTAAASGIKIFTASENNEFVSLKVRGTVRLYFSLSADSGTSELRILELGWKKY